ncbi:MAG: hypothetical protein OEZ39_17165 [Gammaproteobacteria bacterium]|nr:hypothetical protein [Gammaproteobacteria bacterium]MDH5653593.1 hypothetical protein [Gammaproteobacteria bacterium]
MKTANLAALLILLLSGLLPTTAYSADNVEQMVLGNHVMTLQWLTNHRGIGKAKIYKQEGEIHIDGYQQEKYEGNTNYMRILGKLRIINARELEFEGSIVTQINYINAGVPYERNGKFILKATGKRKYWRMQNMEQPDEGHVVTDYIDIFFEKFK